MSETWNDAASLLLRPLFWPQFSEFFALNVLRNACLFLYHTVCIHGRFARCKKRKKKKKEGNSGHHLVIPVKTHENSGTVGWLLAILRPVQSSLQEECMPPWRRLFYRVNFLRLQQSSLPAATIQCCSEKKALKYNKKVWTPKSGHKRSTDDGWNSCDITP